MTGQSKQKNTEHILKLRQQKNLIVKQEQKSGDFNQTSKQILLNYDQQQNIQIRNDQLPDSLKPILLNSIINIPQDQVISTIQIQMWSKIKNYFSKTSNITQALCQICLERLNTNNTIKLCSCQHLYCQQCTTQYLNARIKAFQTVKCLDQNCNSEINQNSTFYSSLPNQTKLKHQKIKRFYFVSKNPDLKLCPKQTCSGILNTKKKPSACNACLQNYCPKCLLKDHWGKCQNQSLVYFQNNLKYIQCSHCNFIIQKNQGCDHITCKCGYQLCYKCGGVWKGPKHLCVRSKVFQKTRSLMLSFLHGSGILQQNSPFRKFLNAIGAALFNIMYANVVLAVILTLMEIIYSVFSWISPFGYILGLFGGEEKADQIQEMVEQGGFPYLWVYLGLVFGSWCLVRKLVPTYKMKYFIISVGIVTGIMYLLSNLLLIFYYEYILVSYIVENTLFILCFGINLIVVIYFVKIVRWISQKNKNKSFRHTYD